MDPSPQLDPAHGAKFIVGPCQAFWGRSWEKDLARWTWESWRGWQAAHRLPLLLLRTNE